ncbi:MAG: LuxR C-terminal-related transcriptional regulator [Vulcanimicrobiaceae bacterium]
MVAPAGFGKSVALRDFIQTSRLEVVRYDVGREDATLLTFVRRLGEALEPVAPSAIAAFPPVQERVLAAEEPVRQLSDWFAEHLKRTVCTIVIDDLHYAAADPASIALLADLIERTSERIKWIIAARSDAGLPVGSWVAYGRMDLPIGEDELRFTADEALATAEASAAELDPQEVESLRRLTDGWPVALAISLRTLTHSHDLRSASLASREMVYRYLAEQVFAALSPSERAFALATCVFSGFDAGVVEALGRSHEFVTELRRRIAFLSEVAPGAYRYHDLFRDFLEAELRGSGEAEWLRAVCRAGKILAERGNDAEALALFAKAKAADEILAIVARSGFALFERGEAERLAIALGTVPDGQLIANAAALGLRAMLESGRGRFELAQRRFTVAIEAARDDPALRIFLVYRYAIELVRHDGDCIGLLEPYALDERLSDAQRVPLLGTLATAYARAERGGDAVATIERALALLDPAMNPEMLARLYQQAAFVFHGGPATDRTRSYATTAIELALAHDLYEVAARAYSALFTVVYNEEDDPIASLAILDKLEESAKKGASDQARLFALIAAYEIEADRGDEPALARLDRALHENQSALPRARGEALLPATALRAAWEGNFEQAATLLRDTLPGPGAQDRLALRAAEIALYSFAAGDRERGAAAFEAAVDALEHSPPKSRRTIRAQCFLALAELVRGHAAGAHHRLQNAERGLRPQMTRQRALVHAVRAWQRVALGGDPATLASALERLRAEHFGGIARLLAALPVESANRHAFGALTGAEREILQMLAQGASTKDVAGATGRSRHTVDTHVRSLCRKLSCSGRREAVALATSQGWVEP